MPENDISKEGLIKKYIFYTALVIILGGIIVFAPELIG
ncbi:MAG: hypothetical protein J07HQW1_00238 [Haloquadratum walsbyi J07HQW1]|jgi:hypothetical protein|uniref:Uncharacterized protein n=1 Tax=Haloquadratum walsbyi J07HQW1 TaxID=1238424 RepID=U1N179_9EURY|nr:MAG: hypothetical protein J07HQW1_00238 [Haloquadratum walsbyi J07HQW1]